MSICTMEATLLMAASPEEKTSANPPSRNSTAAHVGKRSTTSRVAAELGSMSPSKVKAAIPMIPEPTANGIQATGNHQIERVAARVSLAAKSLCQMTGEAIV